MTLKEPAIESTEAELALLPPPETAAIVLPGQEHRNPHQESVFMYLSTLGSDTSRATARSALRKVARILGIDNWERVPWCAIRAQHCAYVRAMLVKITSPENARLVMVFLKRVLGTAFELGHMSSEDYLRAVSASSVKIHGERVHKGRMLKPEEVQKLRTYIGRELVSPYREMVDALFMVALGCGLRREELARLVLGSLKPDGTLVAHGKGNKEREIPVPPKAAQALESWLGKRAELGLHCSSVFVQLSEAGVVRDCGLSKGGVWGLIVKTQRAADVAPFIPHDLRRTFGSNMFNIASLQDVQKLMGHADPKTTMRYDMRQSKELGKLAKKADGWLGDEVDGEDESEMILFHQGEQALTKRQILQKVQWLRVKKGYTLKTAVLALAKLGVTRHGRAITLEDLA